MPGTNFRNQCDGLTLSTGNVSTQFLTGCHQLAEDIPVCQAAGKKVFLSLGGDVNQKIESEASFIKFATFLGRLLVPEVLDYCFLEALVLLEMLWWIGLILMLSRMVALVCLTFAIYIGPT